MNKSVKNTIIIGIIIIALDIVGLLTYGFIKTKDYWITLFGIKKHKIELSTIESTDSLLNVIRINSFEYNKDKDSLNTNILKLKNELELKNNIIKDLKNTLYYKQTITLDPPN